MSTDRTSLDTFWRMQLCFMQLLRWCVERRCDAELALGGEEVGTEKYSLEVSSRVLCTAHTQLSFTQHADPRARDRSLGKLIYLNTSFDLLA